MSLKKIKISQLQNITESDVSYSDTDLLHMVVKEDGQTFFKGKKIDTGNFSKVILDRGRDAILNDVTASTLTIQGDTDLGGDLFVSGNIVADGSLRAQELIVTTVSRSVVYESGSTAFGDTSDDTHTFTGSILVNGDISIDGTVDGVDISTFSSSVSNRLTTNEVDIDNLQTDVINLQTDSASFSTRVTDLEFFSSSLDDIYISASGQDVVLGEVTASNMYLNGDLNIDGQVIAKSFITEYVSSSTIYESGSTKFGDTLDDSHDFTGSVNITQSLVLSGSSKFGETFNDTHTFTGNILSDKVVSNEVMVVVSPTASRIAGVVSDESGSLFVNVYDLVTSGSEPVFDGEQAVYSLDTSASIATNPYPGDFTADRFVISNPNPLGQLAVLSSLSGSLTQITLTPVLSGSEQIFFEGEPLYDDVTSVVLTDDFTGDVNLSGSLTLNDKLLGHKVVEYYYVTSSTTQFELKNDPINLYDVIVTPHTLRFNAMVNEHALLLTSGDTSSMAVVPDFRMSGSNTVVISGSGLTNTLYGGDELMIVEYDCYN